MSLYRSYWVERRLWGFQSADDEKYIVGGLFHDLRLLFGDCLQT